MNNRRTSTPLSTRAAALTACLIALSAGAIACGSDGAATAPAAIARQGTSPSFTKSTRANQADYLRQLRAKREAAIRPQAFGDDRRQESGHSRTRAGHSQHPPGYDPTFDAPR